MGFSEQFVLQDVYENGEIELRIYDKKDGTRRWVLKAGVGVLEFDYEQFADLLELMKAYHDFIEYAYPEVGE